MDYTKIIFLDASTTCWEKPADQPAGQINELICIDLAVVDTTKLEIKEKELLFIKPQKSKISEYCEKHFGISQELVDKEGLDFSDIYRHLCVYHMTKNCIWASWGQYDKQIIDKQCKNLKLDYPLSYHHMNIQYMYGIMTGTGENTSLRAACERLSIKLDQNNAVNLANIFFLMSKGLHIKTNKPRISSDINDGRFKYFAN